MVYEKECSNCDRVLDFGGRDRGNIPKDAIEFDGNLYCRECVKELVMFGIGDVQDRIADLEEEVKKIKDAIGLERH